MVLKHIRNAEFPLQPPGHKALRHHPMRIDKFGPMIPHRRSGGPILGKQKKGYQQGKHRIAAYVREDRGISELLPSFRPEIPESAYRQTAAIFLGLCRSVMR